MEGWENSDRTSFASPYQKYISWIPAPFQMGLRKTELLFPVLMLFPEVPLYRKMQRCKNNIIKTLSSEGMAEKIAGLPD